MGKQSLKKNDLPIKIFLSYPSYIYRSIGFIYIKLAVSKLVCYNVAYNKGEINMSANAVVRARIDEQIKKEASIVLEAMGLTVSDAFRILLVRVAREKALPFEPLVPNAETIKAVEDARNGKFIATCTLDNLLAELNADD